MKNIDIHTKTAMQIFGVTQENVTPNMRLCAKRRNFALIYNAGPKLFKNSFKIKNNEIKLK